MLATISRVFMNGNSQAVRIPQAFRLDTSRVEIFRTADGDLVLHPVPTDRGAAMLDALKGFDDEFVALLEAVRSEQLPMQERASQWSTCSTPTFSLTSSEISRSSSPSV
jgi:antitoxin VapB